MINDRSRQLYRELFGEDLEPARIQEEDFLPAARTRRPTPDTVDPTAVHPADYPHVRIAVPIKDDGAA